MHLDYLNGKHIIEFGFNEYNIDNLILKAISNKNFDQGPRNNIRSAIWF